MKRKVTLLTGGSRSGKSSYALRLAAPYRRKVFIATAEPLDAEMQDRIAKHRADRDASFITLEEPRDPAGALQSLPAGTDVVVIDCITVWLGNLFHAHGTETDGFAEVERLLEVLREPPCDVILVTNEVGLGIIPDNALARRFRDAAGFLNQRLARVADEAAMLVSGLPLTLKAGGGVT